MSEFQAVHTDGAPAALGPYSQAIRTGSLVFCSGQIPLDPQTMKIVEGGMTQQIRQVFDNLKAVAHAAGSSLQRTVKLTIFLTDLGEFATVNEIMAEYFTAPYPARATVEVAALPKGANVEVEATLAV